MALLLKRNENLYVYETLAKDGAKLRHWKDFIRYYWNLLYERIVFRKLIVNTADSPECDDQIEEDLMDEIEVKLFDFIKITEKKPYRLSCDKLFCASKPKAYEVNDDWSKAKGFYCSQLVAAAFMHAGIMKIETCSGRYLPGSFAVTKKKESLSLKNQFDLGAEFLLDFTNSV